MQVERFEVAEPHALQYFADMHKLNLHVLERPDYATNGDETERFTVRFKCRDKRDGYITNRIVGNGKTEDDAIESYCNLISNQLLVIDHYGKGPDTTIRVPRLLYKRKDLD